MVSGINSVGMVYPQQKKESSNALLKGAAIAAGAAGCGYIQHNIVSKEIKRATKACDEAQVRQELKNFWKEFKDGDEFLERAVKNRVDFNKKCLKDLKKFHKGATFGATVMGAAVVSLLLYLPKLVQSSKNKQKNV